MHLHGKQKQPTRLDIFQKFSSSSVALLICTDIASRGLDFPSVDWVLQLDCPEDVETYIHRVGRTARYMAEGKGLVFLLPTEEEGMKKRWEEKGLEVKSIKIKESKMGNLKQQMQSFAFRDPEIKYLGQRVRACEINHVPGRDMLIIPFASRHSFPTYAQYIFKKTNPSSNSPNCR